MSEPRLGTRSRIPSRNTEPQLKGLKVGVIGGGIIGLSCAWRLASFGAKVTVWTGGDIPGTASPAAGGMLSVSAEMISEDGSFCAFCRESQARWPEFAAELQAVSGVDVELDRTGTILVARTEAERREIEAAPFTQVLSAQELSALEPAISPDIELALHAPADGQVNNRRVLAALREACAKLGVELKTEAEAIVVRNGHATGVKDESGTQNCDRVLLAAGVWTDRVLEQSGLERLKTGIYPVKGQMLALDCSGLGWSLKHVVRAPGLYLVPRKNNVVVVGATSEELCLDLSVSSLGVEYLRFGAASLVPQLRGVPVLESWTGLRPKSPWGPPVLGPSPIQDLFLASGHYRNGILLAPLTADLVAGFVVGALSDADAGLASSILGIDAAPAFSDERERLA